MSQAFRTLALLGKANNDDVNQTINALYKFLREQKVAKSPDDSRLNAENGALVKMKAKMRSLLTT